MIDAPADVEPLLASKFDGARKLGAIPAAQFASVLTGWESDVNAFIAAGVAAFQKANA